MDTVSIHTVYVAITDFPEFCLWLRRALKATYGMFSRSVPPCKIEFMIEHRRQLTVCFGHRPRTAVQQNDGKGAHNVAAAIFLIFNIRFPSGLLLRRSRQDQATPNKRIF